MGRPRKNQGQPEDTHLSDAGTSSKDARHKAEYERQKQARAEREAIVESTKQAQKQTADFIKNKPTDSRTIADTRA